MHPYPGTNGPLNGSSNTPRYPKGCDKRSAMGGLCADSPADDL